MPLDWAMTQNNLGNALQELGRREEGTARLEAAVLAHRGAWEVYEASGATHYSRLVTRNLTHAEALLAERRAGA